MITGGGTAGHVLPALAIAEALVDAGRSPDEIHYVGARRGIETTLLPRTPFPHTFLDVVGLQRELNAANVRRNAAMLPKLAAAARQARALLRRLQPQVVVSVGGYASLPTVVAARRVGVPVVVVSYDRRPGRASQLTARIAAASAVAFADSPLPRAVVTGAPVRRSILAVDRTARPRRRPCRARPAGRPLRRRRHRRLAGLAGPQRGRRRLRHRASGRRVPGGPAGGRRAVPRRRRRRHRPATSSTAWSGSSTRSICVYAAADLLIGRGGASTVVEVAVTGTPSILVPWAASAEDHQTLNVRWLADQGAAVLLAERDLARLGRGDRQPA